MTSIVLLNISDNDRSHKMNLFPAFLFLRLCSSITFDEHVEIFAKAQNATGKDLDVFRREKVIFFHSISENSRYYVKIKNTFKNNTACGCVFIKEKSSSKLFIYENKTLLVSCEKILCDEHLDAIFDIVNCRIPEEISTNEEIREKSKNFEYSILTNKENYLEMRNISFQLLPKVHSMTILNTGKLYAKEKYVLYNTRVNFFSVHKSPKELISHVDNDIRVLNYYELRRTKGTIFAFLEERINQSHIETLLNILTKCKDVRPKIIEPSDVKFVMDVMKLGESTLPRYAMFNGELGIYKACEYNDMEPLITEIKGISMKNITTTIEQESFTFNQVIVLNGETIHDYISQSKFPLILFYSQDTDFSIVRTFMKTAEELNQVFGLFNIDMNGKCGGMLGNFDTVPFVAYMFTDSIFTKLEGEIKRESIVSFIHELETVFTIDLPKKKASKPKTSAYVGKGLLIRPLYIHAHSQYQLCTSSTRMIKWNGDGHYYLTNTMYDDVYYGYGRHYHMHDSYIRYDSYYASVCVHFTQKEKQFIYYYSKEMPNDLLEVMPYDTVSIYISAYYDQ